MSAIGNRILDSCLTKACAARTPAPPSFIHLTGNDERRPVERELGRQSARERRRRQLGELAALLVLPACCWQPTAGPAPSPSSQLTMIECINMS